MINQFNQTLDNVQDFIDQTAKDFNFRHYLNMLKDSDPIQQASKHLQENENTREFYNLVKNANNYQTCKFRFMDKNHNLSYLDRRRMTSFPIFFLSIIFILKRTGGLRKIFYLYLMMSGLICRENFNLRNYKLKSE